MLIKNRFEMLTTNEIAPAGWLKRQLEVQAMGLSGNLDKIWPDVRDSRWIGGDREGWERVPYWLDGFIPLAWLLDDADMKARAVKYIDAIIERQQPDGWICPCGDSERKQYDMWALFLIGKVLVGYYQCSGDGRIEQVLYRAFRNFREHINRNTLFNWSATRWYEALVPIYWLYERRPEKWLLDLANLLYVEGTDYRKLYQTFPMDKIEKGKWSYTEHVVNTAMALKAEALYSRISGQDPEELANLMLGVLLSRHGMAVGHFTGDECLAGDSPIQGSECCGVAEAMYSYEHLLAVSGNPVWGDYLERLAYNAFPATVSPDMWTHQYDQMTNQPQCRNIPKEEAHYLTNGGESNQFGLEPNFGCCTANFNQAWPKFALSAFMKSEKGIAVTLITPARVRVTIEGTAVEVETVTDYPFDSSVMFIVRPERPVTFELAVRVPGCAKSADIDGGAVLPGSFHTISREWKEETKISMSMEFEAEFRARPNDLVALWRGPLLYSVAIDEKWVPAEYCRDGVERKFPYCDYEIFPMSKWNYAFCSTDVTYHQNQVGEIPFDPVRPPVHIMARAKEIPWKISQWGVCEASPADRRPLGEAEEIRMIPYGCTDIRMTELPMLPS